MESLDKGSSSILVVYILDDILTNDELEKNDELITTMTKQMDEIFERLKSSGKTQKLWVQYHEFVQLIRDYIRAERLSDAKLHM